MHKYSVSILLGDYLFRNYPSTLHYMSSSVVHYNFYFSFSCYMNSVIDHSLLD